MRRFWPISLALFCTFIVSVVVLKNAGRGDRFFSMFASLPHYDKIGHFVLMGILAFVSVAAIAPRLRTRPWRASLLVMAGVTLVVAAEELSQSFFASRTFSAYDLAFSVAGIACLGPLGHLVASKAEHRP